MKNFWLIIMNYNNLISIDNKKGEEKNNLNDYYPRDGIRGGHESKYTKGS